MDWSQWVVDNGCLHWGALLDAGVNLTGLWTRNDLEKNTTKRNPKELTKNWQNTTEIATVYDKKGFDYHLVIDYYLDFE